MNNNNSILICTGGTGGHVIPAVNFGNYLNELMLGTKEFSNVPIDVS